MQVQPDVIVMDVLMPNMDGIAACREIMSAIPATRVIMLTASTDEEGVIEAMAAGAMGYLQKVSGRDHLLDSIQGVVAGQLRVPAEVLLRTIADLRGDANMVEEPATSRLTQRELEILSAFSRGTSYAEIAEVRAVKTATIRNAIYGIQEKLGVSSNQELVIWSMRNGLLDDYDPGP